VKHNIKLKDICDIEWEDVHLNDHPDYCDAFISFATYEGRDMTEDELDWLMDEHSDWCHENLMESLH